MERFLEIVLKHIGSFVDLLTPVRYCDEGQNVIVKRFGRPKRAYKPGICWKIPVLETFDTANMKKQLHFLNAHSVMAKTDKIVPYNITIDAQVEFKILNPFVIYHIDVVDGSDREPLRIYVDNEVHLIINDVVADFHGPNLQERINTELEKRNKEKTGDYFRNAILIERIVISAYDYNLSLRHAQ